MTYTIAIAGKGGVGKSTISALAVLHLHRSTKEVVLAVDADPNSNLGAKLETDPGRTLGDLREEIVTRGEEPPDGMSKQEYVDYQIRLALREGSGFDLISMGRQEGPGCYCYVNNILRTILDSISSKYSYVVIDNEAGMEHLSRRTTQAPNQLLVVADRSKAALDAARRISDLANHMKIRAGRKILVLNMLDPGSEGAPQARADGFDAVYGVRMSGLIRERAEESESLLGIPPTDPAYADVARLLDAERKRR